MKKTLSFEKDLELKTKILDVVKIELDDDLKYTSNNTIEGSFYISGRYKMYEASTIDEEFSFNVPINAKIDEDLVLDTVNLSIANFTYEVVDDSLIRAKIDVLLEGVIDVKIDERDCDSEILNDDVLPIKEEKKEKSPDEKEKEDSTEKDEEIPKKEEDNREEDSAQKEEKETSEKESIKVNSLFADLGEDADTYTTYSVYIMRENDTIDSIMKKYDVTKEELENYNDLSLIALNSKVIIPNSKQVENDE